MANANYQRLVRECEEAQVFMDCHFAGRAPSLRQFCDDNDLTYLRMINRTYPLKKVTQAECNRILAATLADYQAKAAGQVRRAPGGGRPAVRSEAAAAPPADQVIMSVDDYRRLVHLAQEDREKQFRTYNNLRKDFNDLLREEGRPLEGCFIQPPQPLPVLTTKAQVEAHLKRQVERYERQHPAAAAPVAEAAPPLLQLEDGVAEEQEQEEEQEDEEEEQEDE